MKKVAEIFGELEIIRNFASSNKKLNLLNTIKEFMEKKYILTDETITYYGHVLHRIKAVRSFGNIKEGDLGGWIEKEENLTHDGNCWVGDEAKVYGNAKVRDNAKVQDNTYVYGNASVYGNAEVYGYAEVYGDPKVYGNAEVYGDAEVCGNAEVYDDAKVYGNAWVSGYAYVRGNAEVYGNALVYGEARVYDNAMVYGYVEVNGNAQIGGDAHVSANKDYMVFKNNWSSGRYFTWTRSNDMWSVGCFYGTGKKLIKKAYKDSEDSGKHYEATVNYVENIKKI